jgi:hypothetical protein
MRVPVLSRNYDAARIHEALPHRPASTLLRYIRPILRGRPERLLACRAHAPQHLVNS